MTLSSEIPTYDSQLVDSDGFMQDYWFQFFSNLSVQFAEGIVGIELGGTGADNATDARFNLGLEIGVEVQPFSEVLANTTASFTLEDEIKLDGLTAGSFNFWRYTVDGAGSEAILSEETLDFISGGGITLTNGTKTLTIDHTDTSSIANVTATGAEVISAVTFDTFGHTLTFTKRNLTPANIGAQPVDAGLTSISALVTAADTMIYTTALDTYTTTALTAFARTLLDDADAGTMRTTLGLGTIATFDGNQDLGTGDDVNFAKVTLSGDLIMSQASDGLMAQFRVIDGASNPGFFFSIDTTGKIFEIDFSGSAVAGYDIIYQFSNTTFYTRDGATGDNIWTGRLTTDDTTDSTSTTTGSGVFDGGLGIAKSAYIGGAVRAGHATTSVKQSDAAISVRGSSVSLGFGLEFGHNNASGFGSFLGNFSSSGDPIIVFNGIQGTNANTIETLGRKAILARGNSSGGLDVQSVPTATADNQAPVQLVNISNTGGVTVEGSITSNDTTDSSSLITGSVVSAGGGAFAKRLFLGDHLVMNKASTGGIKVDNVTPTFGFADLLGDQFSKNVGATKPTLATYNGAINCWQFGAGDEAYLTYHIPHDYVLGSDIFLHIHWSHNSTTVTGGSVTFQATSIYSKGHDQAAFQSTPAAGTFVGNASTTQYQHVLTETSYSDSTPTGIQLDTDLLEPDGVVEMTFELLANNITSSASVPAPFIHYVDIHYQTNGLIGTKAKAPDFYA